MNKSESKQRIMAEWDQWKNDPDTASYLEMQEFYGWLEDKHLELLQWKITPGVERWQDVRAWLNKRVGYGGA